MSISQTLLAMASLSFATLAVLKTTALLAVVAAVALLLRRHSAALRHLLWSLGILGIIALPVAMATSPFTLHLLPERPAVPSEPRAEVQTPQKAERTPPPAREQAVALQESEPVTPDRAAAVTDNVNPAWLLAVWLIGALLLLTRYVAGVVRLRGVVRRAARVEPADWLGRPNLSSDTSPSLRMSDEVDMPFASGLLRPTIVLPAASRDWTGERRFAVLQHELAHLSRGDLLMNALSHIARSLYWFNPLAWYAAYRVRIESERACDDAVLRQGARASDYAEHLLSIAGSGAAAVPAAALAMARPSAFEGRLLAILEPELERSALSRVKVALAAVAFVAIVMPLAAASPTAAAAAMAPEMPEATLTAGVFVQVPPTDSQPPAAPVARPEQQATSASSAVLALMEAVGDANATVRLAAITSLGQLGDPRAIAALGKALREDTDARVRRAAAEALGEIDDARAVPHLIGALRGERVSEVRAAIVEALGEIDDPGAVPGIVAVVRDSSVAVRRAAASALDDLDDPAALPALLTMVRDTDTDVRRQVASALSDLESSQTLDALTLLAKDSDGEVRAAAVNGLGNLEEKRTLNTLLAALADPVAEVRAQAADAIHNIPDMDKAPPQLIALLSDPDADVRQQVAHALGSFEDEAAVPGLKRALSDTNADVRHAAAEALSEIGGADAITALMGLLKDPDPEIRRIAAEALGQRRRD